MVCLHGVEIGSIDLLNSKTYKLKNSRFAYFLKNPNASWLRSFRPPWGLGGKKAGKVIHHKATPYRKHSVIIEKGWQESLPASLISNG